VLVSVMLALLLITVSVIGVTSFVSARSMVRYLSDTVLAQSGQRIEEQVRGELDLAVAQGTLDAALLGGGRIDPRDREAVSAYFLDAIRAHPQLSYLSWTLDDSGNHVTVERNRDGSLFLVYLIRQPDDRLELHHFRVHPDGRREQIALERDKPKNDPRPRPYYVAARDAKAPTWTDTYVFLGQGGRLTVPGVTRATPIYQPDGALLGVLSADFDLFALSEFLGELQLSANGFAFLVEFRADGTRRVIAHPKPELLARSGGEPIAADEIADARVRGFLSQLAPGGATNALIPVSFEADGVEYVGGYRRIEGDRGLRWAVALVIPEDDIMGPIARSRRLTIGITIASTILAVILAVLLSMQIGKALRLLASETQAIGKFHLQAKPVTASSVVEIQQLALAIEDMKTGLRSFQKFVPSDLVRTLVASGHEAKLGGGRATITMHFSDIADFTTISETMRPEELVELLSEYLSLMSREILASGGTIDKFIGDAVMAFWNAPRTIEDHAMVAVRTVLANHRALAAQRTTWLAAGKPGLHARVALHTGDAVVGNIGSEARLDFTAIGDTVNLASRLEGLNKLYGTELLISDATLRLVEGRVVVRPLDRVAVKGKTTGSMIYELLGLTGEVDAGVVALAERHARAMDAYFAQRWDDAIELLDPVDEAAKVIRARASEFRSAPPPADWDGIYRATSK
jgi:adenylate cyclase